MDTHGGDFLITRTVMEIQMDTQKKIREHISALSDGELSASDLELAFAALRAADGEQAWNTYHRIGDVLRAQASPELSDGFSKRLAERLAAEPTLGKRAAPAVAAEPGAKKVATTTS
jgi:sigma-E factor negative regulatory protein RseA